MHEDHQAYFKFTGKSRIDKASNSLMGILEGIVADGKVSAEELRFLRTWISEHEDVRQTHPFNELIPQVDEVIADGVITEDERADIMWLCDRLLSTRFYDEITADLQRLHGIMAGIVADGVVTEEDFRGLSEWLEAHEHLRTCWPFDEVDSLITAVLADRKIDEDEHEKLKVFFSEFVDVRGHRAILEPPVADGKSLKGLCAVCPEITFPGSVFCFTGASGKGKQAAGGHGCSLWRARHQLCYEVAELPRDWRRESVLGVRLLREKGRSGCAAAEGGLPATAGARARFR